MTVKVQIERDECISCAACWDDCPDVFEENMEDGLSQVVEDYQVDEDPAVGEIPDDLEECAQDAADACPVEIIQLS
jgi:ferredoxin